MKTMVGFGGQDRFFEFMSIAIKPKGLDLYACHKINELYRKEYAHSQHEGKITVSGLDTYQGLV